ncbi:MAG: haloacid dehalogenase-like hydrolase [Tateyamaria sp.]|jgi:phosphoglycolate phosphatase-like HAD superfamily hydrolase|nr:haloacid dehalogenase-like hydrolase [Tateyamaria sp.]MBT7800820.1 haloacid dehalogenase-like hydrolase [Tateyamaria sp.]MCH9747656.1 haloacid dehalogenase-like hydrolase [Alphaproteobacteria bacterium]
MKYFIAAGLSMFASAILADPLPSWSETDTKQAIINFVERVTDPTSPDYVTAEDRVAVFDNDGTLWSEQPVYFQLAYALYSLEKKAASDPSILTSDTLRAAASGDVETVIESGSEGLLEVIAVSHSGMTVNNFQDDVVNWLENARHSTTGKRYTDMVYQPMQELLRYLRDEDFQTYIVSGGGVDFMRAFSKEAYNIPNQQVIGSTGPAEYSDGEIIKLAGDVFINDKEGKPLGISSRIGKRPIFASGNSDGDFAMLEYTTAGPGPSFGMLLHHTDGEREFAYDREGHIGVLNKGLDESGERGWVIIDMASDWKQVWP